LAAVAALHPKIFASLPVGRAPSRDDKLSIMQPPLTKRILLILAAFAIQAIYTPTSLFMKGGIEPRLSWDIFPLSIGWVIPYVLCYPLWIFGIGWLVWKMDERLFRATVAGFFFTFSLGILVYLLFPTYVVHPDISGSDILSKILLYLTILGGDYDAFPSAHIYMTVVLSLFYSDWYPRHKLLWLFVVVIISLSTLFTKQHYVADVIGGIVAGWLGYRFGIWWNTLDIRRIMLAR
jgi:membrane-associated phospholipid phosphatase